MSISNYERITRAMDLLKGGLGPFVEREFTAVYGEAAPAQALRSLGDDRMLVNKPMAEWDASALLRLMWDSWHDVFRRTFGHAERTLVSELRELRNNWAHQSSFSSRDAERGLDSITRLLTAVGAPQADEVERLWKELRRLQIDEQERNERRKGTGSLVEGAAIAQLKPWREVATPHRDVASGRYQQAEFAADLWQVYLNEGGDEYRDPVEFFRRTYLTESLTRLLAGALQRLSGEGGDPVVQLQTNFGGGKTHSMLALYHLVSGTPATELVGIERVMASAGVSSLPTARRVVLVGNKISPGNPTTKPDGTVVRTLWGELAWQLGGRAAYERLRADDEHATSPGDLLRQLFNEYGPCLVLIDEWVAYARLLHDGSDLPGGSFETQFTFAQVLTESAKLAQRCLLVVSLPASDSADSPHAPADDVEVGGLRGREALDRLRNVIGRVESSWRPASAEEGFEIVRRRLFEDLTPAQYTDRDVVARAFADLYRTQGQEFPPECSERGYETRIKAAYPIHPEIFDQLYSSWSTLVKFQRTRGVLRLMAAVIHRLYESGDRSPLIMPATIPIDDQRVQFELTRYLSDNWLPILAKDVDGADSLPVRLDNEISTLGRYSAARRVARTVYLGSAPTPAAANRGLEDRRVKLGCVLPTESPAVYGDALRRLASTATYLYQDGPRYWYSTQPTVTKLAEDRADGLKREPDKVTQEIERHLRAALTDPRKRNHFARIHAMPGSSADVPDDPEARLVVLGVEYPYTKDAENAAEAAAKSILTMRGNSPRLCQNTLVFLAADKTRLQDLDEAVRKLMAWDSILRDGVALDLSPHQTRQAQEQQRHAEGAVTARLPETYQWLLVPTQSAATAPVAWEPLRLAGGEGLAERAFKRLTREELLVTSYGASMLRMRLDNVPLWRGDHVAIRQLLDDYARYLYLPRLSGPEVLLKAIRDGINQLTWEHDGFAYADGYDEVNGRYRSLRHSTLIELTVSDAGVLVRPEVALRQLEDEAEARRQREQRNQDIPIYTPGSDSSNQSGSSVRESGAALADPPTTTHLPLKVARPTRYHGSVPLNPERAIRDVSQIADEVLTHLVGLVGARVRVTLEIEADIPEGTPENVVRTVTENGRALKFTNSGFEME